MSKKKNNGKPLHPLRKIRDEKGFTQAELSSVLDLTGNGVSQIESGNMELPKRVLFRLCDMFDLDAMGFVQDIDFYRQELKQYLISKI